MMQLTAHQSAEDLQKHVEFLQAHSKTSLKANPLKTLLIMLCSVGVTLLWLRVTSRWDGSHEAHTLGLFILPAVLFSSSQFIASAWVKRGGQQAWFEKHSGDYRWEIGATGLHVFREQHSNVYPWSKILALVETEDSWYFFLSHLSAHRIPKSALKPEDQADFKEEMGRLWAAHPDNHGLVLQDEFLKGLNQKPLLGDFYRNVRLGFKLACFRKVDPLDLKVNFKQIAGLIVAEMIVLLCFDYSQFFPDAMFSLYGVTEFGATILLFLLAALCISSLTSSWQWLERLMVMLLATLLTISAVYYLSLGLLNLQSWFTNSHYADWILWGVKTAWTLSAVWWCLRLLYGLPAWRLVFMLSHYAFITLAIPASLTQYGFFTEDYKKEALADEAERPDIDEEAVYYKQNELMGKMLAGLKPQRKGVVDLYYLGFAGNAYQKVFTNEVSYAKDLLDKNYDSKDRSALLINYEDHINDTPLANTHNLANAVNGMAKLMDKNEDVLFLYLSSHGSADFEISTSFYPFDMKDLSANKVKEILDASGIKNRIIVVSACYSGGFIDTLKDDNTLILTAARKDRTSFGCSNDLEYTFFGEAYFVQALKNERSFIKAFSDAQKIIADREKTEEPDSPQSLPQMFIGPAITKKLDALTLQLAHKG